jgi:hypothetical protein
MSDEKESKKKKPTYDLDVAEMADIYAQLSKILDEAEVSVKPTADAIEAMAVSICIAREGRKKSDDYLKREMARTAQQNKPTTTTTTAPTNVSAATPSEPDPNQKMCPTCQTVLTRRYPKDGRPSKGFFSCGKCKQYVNEDGTTNPWKQ